MNVELSQGGRYEYKVDVPGGRITLGITAHKCRHGYVELTVTSTREEQHVTVVELVPKGSA